MEHLPPVEDPAYALPRIPFLGHILAYDCRGFKAFPKRQGWFVHTLRDPEDPYRDKRCGPRNVDPALETPENIAAFVQAWLYFGVLDEIFNVILGLNVSLDDFKEARDGHTVLTTSQLRRHIRAWEDKQGIVDVDHYSGRGFMEESYFPQLHSRIYEVLVEIPEFFHKFLGRENFAWARCLTIDLQMVIFILAETLKAAGLYIWCEWQPGTGQGPLTVAGFQEPREILQDKNGNYSAKANTSVLPLGELILRGPKDLLVDKFSELGWCPNEYRMLRTVLHEETTALFIASRLRRPFSSTELSHSSCTADCCLANQVEDGTYQTKHTTQCTNPAICRNIEIDSDIVAQKIQEGRLPLISIDLAPFQQWENDYRSNWPNYDLDIHAPVELRWTETENYIAFSHVWSHGLGNPRSNALPECQLRRLNQVAGLVRLRVGLTEDPAIWIDTLCIPVNQKHCDMRKKAIGTISEIFQKAWQVVVLDADLQQTSTSINRTELCTRVLLCGWMRRLWTLNEAVISGDSPNCQRLLIMFDRGPELYNWMFAQGISSVYHSEEAVKSLIRRLPQRSERVDILSDLTQSLEHRSTSWPEDEPICLAGLLGLDVKRVLERNTAPERMCVVYSVVNRPRYGCYSQVRLNIIGKRWAPRSLLTYRRSGGGNLKHISNRTATLNARGVMLENMTAYFIQDVQEERLAYYGRDPQQPSHALSLNLYPFTDTESAHKEPKVEILKIDRPAVFLNPFWSADVILVSVIGEEAGVTYCEYIRKVGAGRNGDTTFQNLTELVGSNKGQISFIQASNDTKWCLG